MIRTLSLASVIALLPAATVAQEMTDSELHTKSVEAEKATATMAQALVIGLADGVQAPSVTLVDTTGRCLRAVGRLVSLLQEAADGS